MVGEAKVRNVGLSAAWIGTIRRAHAVRPVTARQFLLRDRDSKFWAAVCDGGALLAQSSKPPLTWITSTPDACKMLVAIAAR